MARYSNCNATLPVGSLLCAYCGGRNGIDLKGMRFFSTHENGAPRTCPLCDLRLKTLDLKLQRRSLGRFQEPCFRSTQNSCVDH